MSLRARLFFLIAGLAALLVVGQWWLFRTFSGGLAADVGDVAFSVGRQVIVALDSDEIAGPGETVVVEGRGAGETKVTVRAVGIEQREIRRRVKVEGGPGSYSYVMSEAETAAGEPSEGASEARAVIVASPSPGSEGGKAPREPLVLSLVVGDGETLDEALVLDEGGAGGARRVVPIPREGLDARVKRFGRRMLLGSLGFLAAGLVLAAVVAHRVTSPLGDLRRAALRVAGGELGAQAREASDPDLGATARAFNHMSARLAELEEANRALRSREHLAEIGEVARGIAHTLRNPLNTLGLTVDELSGRAPGPEADELSAAARRQIRRIDRSVRSLLVLAASGGETAVESVDLTALAEDVALEALQDGRGSATPVAVSVEPGPAGGAAPAVRGIPAELRAVLHALVINAVEASPEGGGVRIVVGEAAEGAAGGGVEVRVEDDGPGPAPEVRDRLFSPHVTTKPAGAGMGLYLARRIAVDRYGGRLALAERPGGGARAELLLRDRIEG